MCLIKPSASGRRSLSVSIFVHGVSEGAVSNFN